MQEIRKNEKLVFFDLKSFFDKQYVDAKLKMKWFSKGILRIKFTLKSTPSILYYLLCSTKQITINAYLMII